MNRLVLKDYSMNETSELCVVCGAKAMQRCSGCRLVFYCTREHQKRHWKEHIKDCRPFKLVLHPTLGRHYVATRKINIGEIVLKDEKPIVSGPPHDSVPVCLNCYSVLAQDTAIPCKLCGWPLCVNCTTHGSECDFTQKYRNTKVSISYYGQTHPTYRCIIILRALSLQTSNPEAYQKLMNLEDHYDQFVNDTTSEPLDVARFIKRFFPLLGDNASEEQIVRIIGILQVNAHEVPTTDPLHIAIYDQGSFLEHNCRANCTKSFTNEGGLVIRAALPISKGEHISICYTDPLWGATNRRHHLAKSKYFDCICQRCVDPTEFGTMLNAIKCTNRTCTGNMLPPSFLYNADYICSKCRTAIASEEVEKMLDFIGMDLAKIMKDDIIGCKQFLIRHGEFLHENHFYNTDIKLALAQLIGQQGAALSDVDEDVLNEKIQLCKKMDDLLKVLAPAENRIRGLILFELHAALAEDGKRRGKGELPRILMESKKVLTESYQLLRYEPTILPEGQVAVHARRNLQDVDTIIQTLLQNTPNQI